MPQLVRTFVGIPIPSELETLSGQLIKRLQQSTAKVKWVRPSELHWTLQFLGPVDMRDIPEVCAAVAKAVAPFEPFDVEAYGVGAFPEAERPRTVWIGMREGAEQLIALHDAVGENLAKMSFRQEKRRYRPHLTIGRVRRSTENDVVELGRLIRENAEFDGGPCMLSEVNVFSSELTRSGPVYDVLGHAELLGR